MTYRPLHIVLAGARYRKPAGGKASPRGRLLSVS